MNQNYLNLIRLYQSQNPNNSKNLKYYVAIDGLSKGNMDATLYDPFGIPREARSIIPNSAFLIPNLLLPPAGSAVRGLFQRGNACFAVRGYF